MRISDSVLLHTIHVILASVPPGSILAAMKVPPIAVLLFACVGVAFGQANPSAARLTGHDLMERAYLIAPDLRERDRMNLLLHLCRAAGRYDSALSVKYGTEL